MTNLRNRKQPDHHTDADNSMLIESPSEVIQSSDDFLFAMLPSPDSQTNRDHSHHPTFARLLASFLWSELVSKRRWAFMFGLIMGSLLIMSALNDTARSQRLSQIDSIRVALATQLQSMFPVSNEFISNFTAFITDSMPSAETSLPGQLLADQGASAHFPVFLIPGIASTSLESWARGGCSEAYFRKKIWGDLSMASSLLLDKECWLKNLMLDLGTGLDPPGCKIRVVQGLDAAQFFVPGYWVWAKVQENLAIIGYDSNNMYLAQYDWRLSPRNLEKRDQYFTRLRANLELSKKISGKKSVIIAHSMGGLVLHYFLKWSESRRMGHKTGWVDEHIHAIIDISIPFLGVPKSVASMLSGEMKDTAQLGWLTSNLLDRFVTRNERAAMFRSWGCITAMLPKGGHVVWGELDEAPDDISRSHVSNRSIGSFISFRKSDEKLKNLTVSGALKMLAQTTGQYLIDRLKSDFSAGVHLDNLETDAFDDPRFWTNPLESALPRAPNMKVYHLYGIGKPAERAYFYSKSEDIKTVTFQGLDVLSPNSGNSPHNSTCNHSMRSGKVETMTDKIDGLHIDTEINDPDEELISGVQEADGDGTVPLLSLGFMSASGWRWDSKNSYGKYFNPGKSPIVSREYQHQPLPLVQDARGGPKTADHVDILGNYELIEDILRIVSNHDEHLVNDRLYSNIQEISEKIKLRNLDLSGDSA